MLPVKKRYVLVPLLLSCAVVVFIYSHLTPPRGDSGAPKVTFEWLIEPRFNRANDFACGVAWVQEESGGTWKQIDREGNVLIDNYEANLITIYDEKTKTEVVDMKKCHVLAVLLVSCLLGVSVWTFSSHFLPELSTSRRDSANSSIVFRWLIEPRFKYADDFYKGVAWANDEIGNVWNLYDRDGNVLIHDFQASFVYPYDKDTGLAEFTNQYRSGYVNISGDIVISAKYNSVDSFRYGVAPAEKNEFWGAINEREETLLPFIYDSVAVLDSNMFFVRKGEKWSYVKPGGEAVTDFIFDASYNTRIARGAYLAVIGEKSGLLNRGGEWILPLSYDVIYGTQETGDELIGVQKEGKVGFVDMRGNVVIDFQYEKGGKYHRAFYIL